MAKKSKQDNLKFIIRLQQGLLVLMLLTLAVSIWSYLRENPGKVVEREIKVTERRSNKIALEWDETRNTEKYTVTYKKSGFGGDWKQLETTEPKVEITDLDSDTEYVIKIHTHDDDRDRTASDAYYVSTKIEQEIECPKRITKSSAVKSFKIGAKAKTKITYSADKNKVIELDTATGKVKILGCGTATVHIKAKATNKYEEASKDVKIDVLNLEPSKKIHTVYTLTEDNCDVVMSVTGSESAVVPQGLAYTGKKFIISYGMSGSQRMVSFDIKTGNKTSSKPSVTIGHPNGLTYCEETGLCYCVRGWSGRVVTYNPSSNEYGVMNLRNGQSGIAYDRINKKFYGSSRSGTSVYSLDYKLEKRFANVNHSGHVYTQDCGGHDGIFIRCLSGSSKHGLNYVDLYNAEDGTYLGTIDCYLSEVESAVVDDEGYLLLLANTSSNTDYIWRTPIRIEGLI